MDIRQQSDPAIGRSAVLGRNASGKLGDCVTARRSSGTANPVLGQSPYWDGPSPRITATKEYDMM
jgi:hypothetical protein